MNIILGGGIAGLWLLNRLNNAGINTLLIDTAPLGGQQTLSAQGIIHGGIKYSLAGKLTGSTKAIADMPERWLACLKGKGEIDLRQTKLLSNHQYLWSNQSVTSKATTFFASKAVSSHMKKVSQVDYPSALKNPDFKGNVYQLNEPVIDIPSLLKNLVDKWQSKIIQADDYSLQQNDAGLVESITLSDNTTLTIDHVILTAGEGNAKIVNSLGFKQPIMQRRPLQMALFKSAKLPSLFAHSVGHSSKPIFTITTHTHQDGDKVWYIGGDVAEEGSKQSADELIQKSKALLQDQLPWLDLNEGSWTTHTVNRAEPKQPGLLRPESVFIHEQKNVFTCWPTKLAFAPLLADKILQTLKNRPITSASNETLAKKPSFKIAPPLWDRLYR